MDSSVLPVVTSIIGPYRNTGNSNEVRFNCFAGDVELLTQDGIKRFEEVSGTTQILLVESRNRCGVWKECEIRSFGEQETYTLNISRHGRHKSIRTTADHWWPSFRGRKSGVVRERRRTVNLRPGDTLPMLYGQGVKNVCPSPFGIAHGIVFGDGSRSRGRRGSHIFLIGEKNKQLLKFFSECRVTPCPSVKDAIHVVDLPRHFKGRPDISESKSYLYGWLAGYFAADGSIQKTGSGINIASSVKENLECVREVCSVLGIGTHSGVLQTTKCVKQVDGVGKVKYFDGYTINLEYRHLTPEFFLIEEHRRRFEGANRRSHAINKWKVESVVRDEDEWGRPQTTEVHCVVRAGNFALADNILTSNCFMCVSRGKDSPDNKGHMYLNIKNGLWVCFRCGAKGHVDNIVGEAEIDIDKWNALDEAISYLEGKVSEEEPPTELKYPCPVQNIRRGSDAWRYVRKRGLNEDDIQFYRLVHGDHQAKNRDGNPIGKPVPRLFVPTYADKQLVFWVGRRFFSLDFRAPKYINPLGVDKEYVFNLEQAQSIASSAEGEGMVIIAEGVFSAMATGRQGVALFGKEPTSTQVRLLIESHFDEYVVALDGDAFPESIEIARYLFYAGKAVSMVMMEYGQDPDSVPDFRRYLDDRCPIDQVFLTRVEIDQKPTMRKRAFV